MLLLLLLLWGALAFSTPSKSARRRRRVMSPSSSNKRWGPLSRGIKKGQTERDRRSQSRSFSQIFASPGTLRAQILKKINLAWKFQSRPSEFPTKIGGWWVARLKISSSLENFKILKFFKIWALRGIAAFRRRRFSQKTAGCSQIFAENRRKPQIFAETRLSQFVPFNSALP